MNSSHSEIRHLCGVVLLIAALVVPTGAIADSIPVFSASSGTVSNGGNYGLNLVWTFAAPSVSIRGFAEFPNIGPNCQPCAPGETRTTSTLVAGSMNGSAVVNGVNYPSVEYGGQLQITGGQVVLSTTFEPVVTLTDSVLFSGSFTGCSTQAQCFSGSSGTDILQMNFNAYGIATMTYTGYQSNVGPLYDLQSVTYTMVPEPGSLGLFMTGLSGVVVLLRRRVLS